VSARAPNRFVFAAWDAAFVLLAVAVAVAIAFALRSLLPVASLALIFVCAVLMVALRSGKAVAAFAALLSALAYNFLFTEPRYTLRIRDAGDVAAVATFFAAALAVGHLASRQREQLVELERSAAKLEAARTAGDTERLRAALLSSVSHDLRTPLAAVIGAATSLATYGETMPPSDRAALVDAIRSEGERLDRYIQNLLDMTRLGSGPLRLERDWAGLDEVVAAASARLRHAVPEAAVETRLEPGLPALFVHAALVEQALFNVLENAARFAPPSTTIRVRSRREGHRVVIDVVDSGPGIAPEERERIFDRFFSGALPAGSGAASRAGRGGLGLTIVRGMIGAHGGSVVALAGDDGVGTTIRIALPLVEPPPALDDDEAPA
jgi:K+-sensing histidine kinase KdpD